MCCPEDPNNARSVDERLSLLYIVLNLDKLFPIVPKDSPALKWHNTDAFKHDWKVGVGAAITILEDMMKYDLPKKAIYTVEKKLQSILDEISNVGKPEESKLFLRCLCSSPEHGARHGLVEGTTVLREDGWPEYIVS